jgi:hypothetical protein
MWVHVPNRTHGTPAPRYSIVKERATLLEQHPMWQLLGEVYMTEAEVQARAILAAALIQSKSIDVNNTNLATDWRLQPNTERLHHLVELLYRAITETRE